MSHTHVDIEKHVHVVYEVYIWSARIKCIKCMYLCMECMY